MPTRLLHLLLTLTLLCNGFAPSWAIGRAHFPAQAVDLASAGAADTAHHCGMRDGDIRTARDAKAVPDHEQGQGDCCDTAQCHCGCVVPPALVVTALLMPRPRISMPPPVRWHADNSVSGRSTPFRPPARPVRP